MKSTRCPQARWRVTAACGLAAAVTLSASGATAGPAPDSSRAERRPIVAAIPEKAKVNPSFGSLPISFEPNLGQAPDGVQFLTRGSAAALTSTGAVLGGGATPVTLEFVGASTASRAAGAGELPGKANYLTGNDPSKWRTNVPTYKSVRVEQLYPGVDLVWYGKGRSLEYDLVVASGTDPNSIAFELDGFPSPELEADGALVAGSVRLERPFAYQEIDGARQAVASRYAVRDSGRVGFELGDYDRSFPLVIDPEIGYSFSLAESTKDIAVSGVAVDKTGAAYVVGSIAAAGTGARDVYIAKLNPEGTALVYSTTIGGSRYDLAYDVAVDDAGNAFVTGETASSDFPTTVGAFQPTFASTSPGDADAIVLKLAPDGDTLVYASYLGGAEFDHGKDIVIDAPGNAYVTGTTTSMNFPTTEPDQAGNGGLADAFVTIVNPGGSAKVSSSYLGGSDSDNGEGIALDAAGNVYVVGATSSTNFPVSPGALQSTFGGGVIDGFWVKYDPTGQRLASTFLGGSGVDVARAVDVDAAGNSFVTGETDVTDFPVVPPVGAKVTGGSRDAYIAELNPGGTAFEFSTFYGGSDYESGNAIVVDSVRRVTVVGDTYSTDFPTVDPVQSTFGGGLSDAFVLQIDPGAASATGPRGAPSVLFASPLGGPRTEFGLDCGVGPSDAVFVGSTKPDLSQDGQENDEGGLTQVVNEPPGPRPDLEVDLHVSTAHYVGLDIATVTVYVRSTARCNGDEAQGTTFEVEIPDGMRFINIVRQRGGPSIVVLRDPGAGNSGTVEFSYLGRVPFAKQFPESDDVRISILAQLTSPAPNPVLFLRANARTDDAECTYVNNEALGELNPNTFEYSPRMRLLRVVQTPNPSAAPVVNLVNNLSNESSPPPNLAMAAGAIAGFKVYSSNQPNVLPVPGNLLMTLPPTMTEVDVSDTPAGSFFVVTTVTAGGESPPSNEVGGTLPEVTKLKVTSSKIVVDGTGFTSGVRVFFGGLPFVSASKLKKANTRVIQKGPLIIGQSIGTYSEDFLSAGATVLILVVNENGNAVAVEYTR